jgi:hypothetical protein
VHELRASKSRLENGIITFHRTYDQHSALVASCKRSALMLRRLT